MKTISIEDRLKKLELATTTSITTTYAGQFAGKYISEALLEGDTLGRSLISKNENIKYKWTVKKGGKIGAMADATCDFTPTGTVTLTERILEPKELQQNILLCKKDYRSDWEAEAMGMSAHDQMPPKFNEWLIAQMLGELAEDVEVNIWEGDGANNGEFDGFSKLFAADADVIDIDNGGTATDASNVAANMGSVIDAIPKTILRKPDMTLYVSDDIFRAYIRALGGFAANGQGAQGVDNKGFMWYNRESPLYFDGVPVQPVNGLGANKMVAAQAGNLWFGTGQLNDQNELKVIDTSEILGDQNVRYISRFTAGVQYGIGKEIVYFWDATP